LSTDGLCAVPGVKVWSVRIDCTLLNDDGNTHDAAVLAAAAALHSFRRPEISIRGDQVTVHTERDPIPLSIHHTPLTFTCALTEDDEFILDPSLAEAQAAAGLLTVGVNLELQVCLVDKAEGRDLSYATVARVIGAAKLLAPQVGALMTQAANDFETKRKEALKAQFLWAQQRTGVGKGSAPSAAENDEQATKKSRTES
jgi:exosome complex component RRP45